MAREDRKLLKWILSVGAFLLGLMLAGCSSSDRLDLGAAALPPVEPVAAAPDPAGLTFDAAQTTGLSAPTINVFGELNGVPVHNGPAAGQISLQQHTYTSQGADETVSVDPTGKWLLYASTRLCDHARIYLQRINGTAVTELTSSDGDDAFPVFSPDGRQIAFCSSRSGNWDLYLMDADGRNVVQLTNGPSQDLHPSFSPDGTRLVYCSLGSRSGQWELWVLNLQSSEKRMIGYGLFPAWSPDKTIDRIAFQRASQRGQRWFGLWTLELTDGEPRRITQVASSTNAAVVCPAWSPDGRYLAYSTVLDPLSPDSFKSREQNDIWIVSADGAVRRRLTDANGSNLTPFWAVDNRVYFVSNRGGTECVWSVRGDVPHLAVATSAPPADQPGISPAEAAPATPTTPANQPVGAVDTGEIAH